MNEYAVEVDRLIVRFGDFTAVNNISFAVKPGEIFGFLGANGAGKTTTIRVLCGLLKPTSGEIKIAGLNPHDGLKPIKKKVGYMSQRFTLYNDLSVEENIAFAASLRKLDPSKIKNRAQALFKEIGFDSSPSMLVQDLSGGIKQRLALAVSMIHEPDILFLDEPTAGVSPAARIAFWDLIREIASKGKTIFVTTHYMDEAEQCGRISLMRNGEIIALDSPENLKLQAFPDPLYEVESPDPTNKDWTKNLLSRKEIKNLEPHGLFWHFQLRPNANLANLSQEINSEARQISPSLEDVFIRFIEGSRE
jgi:ABC-2 type transport system ATP-binding protein